MKLEADSDADQQGSQLANQGTSKTSASIPVGGLTGSEHDIRWKLTIR